MYLNHFNFSSKPFDMNPDPEFFYPSKQHSAAATMLEYAMESQASFCVLTGEIGSGKTTLIRGLVRRFGENVTVGLISNTHQRFRSILPWVLYALGIVPRDESDVSLHEALNEFFIAEYAKGRRTLLVFDEAQNLSVRALEELRLLSNLNSEKDVVLQTMLVGQPELRLKMARPDLRQFAQRVALDFHLNALSLSDVQAYVRHRLKIAGGNEAIFHHKAIELVHRFSGGIPRLINQICDLSLVYAFADGQRRVGATLVAVAVKDRNAGRSAAPSHKPEVVNPAKAEVTASVPAALAHDGLIPERV